MSNKEQSFDGNTPAFTGAALLAQKRAENPAKFAAMKNPALAAVAAPAPVLPAPRVEDAHNHHAVKDNLYLLMPQSGKNKPCPVVEVTQLGLRWLPIRFSLIRLLWHYTRRRTVPVVEPSSPYTSMSTSKDPGPFESALKDRTSRNFRFNPKGKSVALGNQMRQENQLEALKQRIAESACKAGLDGDMRIERDIKRPLPSEAEWWDEPFLPNKNMPASTPLAWRTSVSGCPIHPLRSRFYIPTPAPGDKNKEQKKMRKLKQATDLRCCARAYSADFADYIRNDELAACKLLIALSLFLPWIFSY
ncbi:hypothetical protein K438DRAFT_2142213 [Mycena galopus ATCC 62051]|nr:hypothetical protein K438DRAFT_2142213 [Mycena galopus ATCC 62051]